jgi:ketosteroid isomerase-like protein
VGELAAVLGHRADGVTTDRLAALEARARLRELPSRYAAAYARLDVDALVELYVPDVALASGLEGRDALHRHFTAGIRGPDGDPGQGLAIVILHVANQVVELDGDSAHGVVYCHGEMQRRNGEWYHQAIVYTDDYARVDGHWYFARQRTHELVYGVEPQRRPIGLPPADWPLSQIGRGTLPDRWESWQRFWAVDRTGPGDASSLGNHEAVRS